jgi:hypothetical protein
MTTRARSIFAACFTLLLASAASAVPFWGAKAPMPAGTDPATLRPGEFTWKGDAVPAGPIVVVVSLTEQRAYVYRNGIRIGVSTVSSGKPGHQTPTGIFTVLQKDADHHSKKYNNAAMPFAERLTWDGVALHAGGLPGYPSSHGCIHLPSAFAQLLFQISPMGMTVVVAEEHEAPEDVVHPAAIAPVDVKTGAEDEEPRLAANEDQRWQPEKSPEGPVSILVSAADRRVLVYRNGIEIGRAKIEVRDPQTPLGTHAFTMLDPAAPPIPRSEPQASGEVHQTARWIAVGIPGHMDEAKRPLDPAQADRVVLPPAFRNEVAAILAPGSTLVVTDSPVLEQQTGVALNVLNGDAPESEPAK